ncbi:hypothetical protein Ais01nite_09450 [Asanoa ishikariensis]|uniref:Zinc-finger n=1 Tax=Asanoa ishikariensis TaxID=137265 RepID=A0A1H3T6U7_9ACTN|nr:hypothetical protein [Asanoa ishikariensis]GIF62910.1 hypothetical protein Ais01nite_09450 [Asanoa ishikariensis]SDZ46073.1 hypothetical protein SAMN05421684_5286 [Asanoa ishikariensis]
MSTWHVPDDDLRSYAGRGLGPPLLWSTETHLFSCSWCRSRLASLVPVDDGWARLDAALDAPRPGPVERLLVAVGVPDHTARLLTATPALRLSWLIAVTVTLALTALLAKAFTPVVFLGVAPLLTLVGVAVSFGPGVDPTYELTVTSPVHAFRLLLLRCVAVLSANTLLCAAATAFVPDYGLTIAGWFLPSLALTVTTLLLSPSLGPVWAAVLVGSAWVMTITWAGMVPFTTVGQLSLFAAVAVLSVLLARRAALFDVLSPRRLR